MLNAIHPDAGVMSTVRMGTGNFLCAGAMVVSNTVTENDVVLNTAVTVDHDSVLRSGAYIAAGVRTAERTSIGRHSFIGIGSTLGPGVAIGEGCIVGAGSLVISSLLFHVLAFGVPAKVVRQIDNKINWRELLGGKADTDESRGD